VLQEDEHTCHRVEEGTRRRLADDRDFRAKAVGVEDPFVNVPDAIQVYPGAGWSSSAMTLTRRAKVTS
jgi:hypothetical protein